MEKIKVYGADWCGPTRRTLRHLDNLGVDYDYINVDNDAAGSDWVKSQNNGKEKKPTLLIGDTVLTAPTDQKLEEVLRAQNVMV